MKQQPPISCIIPSYNGYQLLDKHLPSVVKAMKDGDFLIISDDASSDSTVQSLVKRFNLELRNETNKDLKYNLYQGQATIEKKHLTVLILQHNSNVRFAECVNRAALLCSTPYFFLVNNDVSLHPDSLTILRQQMGSDPDIFAIGCLEYELSESGEKSGKNKVWFERGLFQHSKADEFTSGKTAWASGGSSLFSTAKWRELEGFDTQFFPAYWEDTDISWRARKMGWKVLFNQEAVVYHKHETTNTQEFGRTSLKEISWKNAFRFAWKHSSFLQKIEFIVWHPYWQWQRVRSQ